MICPQCQFKQKIEGGKYCNNCGAPLPQESQSQPLKSSNTRLYIIVAVAVLATFFGAIVIALNSDAKRPNVEKRIEAQPSLSATVARAPQTITPQVQSDNTPISGVTMANYSRIQTGMTYAQVVQILGKPGTELSSNEIAGYRTVMYQWQGDGIANMNVMFQNGKVIQKAQFGLK